jgi:hypothetical protein
MKRLLAFLFPLLLSLLAPSAALTLDPVEIDVDGNTAVDISFGGTNARTSAQALINLGAQAASPTLDYWSTITPTSFGALLLSIESVEELGSLFGAGTEFTACDNDGDMWVWDDNQHIPVCESPTEISAGAGISIDNGEISFPLFEETAEEGNAIVYEGGQWTVGGVVGGSGDTTAAQVSVTDSGGYYDNSTVEAVLQEVGQSLNSLEIGGAYTAVPFYSDAACTPGQYAASSGYFYFCIASGTWGRVAFTEWDNPTPVDIALLSAAINPEGNQATLSFSEEAYVGAGGNAGWAMNCSEAGSVTMTYASGSETTTLVYSLGDTPEYGDTCTISYTQPTDGIESATGDDLASLSEFPATNNSIVGYTPPLSDTCSGDLLFYSSFENSTTPTVGTPRGCWDYELPATNNYMTFVSDPAPVAGSYAASTTDTGAQLEYNVSNLGINPASGTVSFYFYPTELELLDELFTIDDGSFVNRIVLSIDDTNPDELILRYRSDRQWTSLSSTACDIETNQWNYVKISWNALASPYLQIVCHEGLNAITANYETPLYGGAWSSPTRMTIGTGGGFAFPGHIDELRLYGARQE